jgi:DNA primase
MARIPDHEIERLKAEVSLLRLVESSGVELKRTGKDSLGRCPVHYDKTPSLVVSEAKTCGTAWAPANYQLRITN